MGAPTLTELYHVHHINPHDSSEHHDTCLDGYFYGLHRSPEPALAPRFYEYQSKDLESAEKLEERLNTRLRLRS